MPEATGQLAVQHRFFGVPVSWVGWASLGLTILAAAGIFSHRFTGGFRGVFAGWIFAGSVALVAILWKKERSVLVWTALAVGVLAAVWVGAEILFPH